MSTIIFLLDKIIVARSDVKLIIVVLTSHPRDPRDPRDPTSSLSLD